MIREAIPIAVVMALVITLVVIAIVINHATGCMLTTVTMLACP
ncbi:MAG TPA: hypothetical protein VHN16_01950 [Streptosporangiaceae bacterium]|nr:hypothetical protein [Streptosporangiaceae bacterium]